MCFLLAPVHRRTSHIVLEDVQASALPAPARSMDRMPTVSVETREENDQADGEGSTELPYNDVSSQKAALDKLSSAQKRKKASTMGSRGSTSFVSLSEVRPTPTQTPAKLTYSAWFRNFFCNSDGDLPLDGDAPVPYDH